MSERNICPYCRSIFGRENGAGETQENHAEECPGCPRLYLLYPFLMFRPPESAPTYWNWEKEVPDGTPPADRRE